jgi:hypothetical protein
MHGACMCVLIVKYAFSFIKLKETCLHWLAATGLAMVHRGHGRNNARNLEVVSSSILDY